MREDAGSVLGKWRFLVGGIVVLAGLALLLCFVSAFRAHNAYGSSGSGDIFSTEVSDSPNAVTGGLAIASTTLKESLASVGGAATSVGDFFAGGRNSMVRETFGGIAAAGRGVGRGFAFAGRGVWGGIAFTGRGIGSGAMYVFRVPGKIVGFIASAPAIIQPSRHASVPVIEPVSPVLVAHMASLAATAAAPVAVASAAPAAPAPAPAIAPVVDSVPAWPIRGTVTTQFGASDWPYQLIHTGIDITDGNRAGTSPIHPFRPGVISQVVHSGVGLGNHIVVDHGGGITSVYGHLASTVVQQGQQVTKDTILGYEGSTGASTGAHLHFETRVNNVPVNPHQFIAGQPY